MLGDLAVAGVVAARFVRSDSRGLASMGVDRESYVSSFFVKSGFWMGASARLSVDVK